MFKILDLIGKNDLRFIKYFDIYHNKTNINSNKMPVKTALKLFSLSYQVSMIGVTYKMYTTLEEIKDINKKYTHEVAQLMKENITLRSKKHK